MSANASYKLAQERYAANGVDTEKALAALAQVPISLHCWQGDDVRGFENAGGELGGGLAVTGNYPGAARNIDELRADLEKALSLIPGKHRLNLHAIYGDFGGKKVERDQIGVEHFQSWFDWCAANGLGLDFNPSCFGHPKSADGFTLSSTDEGIRQFWIRHCEASRKIGAAAGKQLGTPCVTNIWVPDGMKDTPVDRKGYRDRLRASLDTVLKDKLSPDLHIDAVECKLFGIGSESFVVGSHEFYMAYAIQRQTALCLDAGHFHPTEGIADKISALIDAIPHLLLHVSRGVRWDSDHVVLLDDPTRAIFEELVRTNALGKTSVGLDFFDASINRIAAWVIGTRSAQKALLLALLEPIEKLRAAEAACDYTSRLALLEAAKTLPFGEVWEEYLRRNNTPAECDWLPLVRAYEKDVLSKRA